MLQKGQYPAVVDFADCSNTFAGICQGCQPCSLRYTISDRSQVVDNSTHPQVRFSGLEGEGENCHDPSCERCPWTVQKDALLNFANTRSKDQSSPTSQSCTSPRKGPNLCACRTEARDWVIKECGYGRLTETNEDEGRSKRCEGAPCAQEGCYYNREDCPARRCCTCCGRSAGYTKGGCTDRYGLFFFISVQKRCLHPL